MAKPIGDIDFSRVSDFARRIGDAAIVAYYIKRPGTPDDVEFNYTIVRRELDRLCELLGLRVVDADTPQHRMNVAAMLQSASTMIPEE